MQQRVDAARAVRVGGLDHVAGRVAGAGQRGGKLGVRRLGRRGRRKPERRLARGVEPVLQPAQRADRLVVVEQIGSSRNPLEPRKRLRELAPELSDLGRIALRRLNFGRHGVASYRGVNRLPSPAVGDAASILVVEDDAALRMVCRVELELERFRVREAPGLAEARAAVADGAAVLVFLDLHLGHGATDEFLDELRADGIPVVLVSGTVDVDRVRGPRDRGDAEAVRPGRPDRGRPPPRGRLALAALAVAAVRTPAEFESRLGRYMFERSEESRAVRVGEKETSEQAEIVRRYADLFSRGQLEALREAEEGASGRRARAALSGCGRRARAGSLASELVERYDELENRLLAARVTFKGEEMPLRTAQAKLAVLPGYADREELGDIQAEASAAFNPDRLELLTAGEELEAELSGHRRRRSSGTRRRRGSRSASSRRCSRTRATPDRRLRARCATAGSTAARPRARRRCRRAPTCPTCAASRRSRRPTRRSARPRCASRR